MFCMGYIPHSTVKLIPDKPMATTFLSHEDHQPRYNNEIHIFHISYL